MESILLVIHVVVALAIVGLIMLQQGKGAEMGASFGAGASQTVFGSVGSGNFFSRMTAILVAVFFATSFVLAVMAKSSVELDDPLIPELETISEVPASVPTASDEVPEAPADSASDEVPVSEQDASPEVE
jgi:preprotein translocase subunit SecG